MFAIDHAATALLVKRRYPSVPLAPILVSVQAMELAWVGLNYLGIERTTTEATVRSVADVHLAYMPYSHSVGTAVGAAVLVWLTIEKGFGRTALGRAVGIGIVSHLILDLATHGHDIVRCLGHIQECMSCGCIDEEKLAARAVGSTQRWKRIHGCMSRTRNRGCARRCKNASQERLPDFSCTYLEYAYRYGR